MKSFITMSLMTLITSSAFAVAPFSGKIDYKVGDKIKYASNCTVRVQMDLNVEDKAFAQKTCEAIIAPVQVQGESVHAQLNGYTASTFNCVVCAQ